MPHSPLYLECNCHSPNEGGLPLIPGRDGFHCKPVQEQGMKVRLSPFDLQSPVGRTALPLRLVLTSSPFDLQWRCLGLIRGPAFLIAVFAV